MLLISIGRIAQFALLLLTLRFATTFLSPSEMGKVSIVISSVAFFSLMLLNPVGMFMNRRLHAWDLMGQIKTYFSYFWLYLLCVSLFSAVFIFSLKWLGIWNPDISIKWLIFLVCGNLIFGTLNQVVIPSLNMFGHRVWFTFLNVATVASSLMFALALVLWRSPSAENWLSGLLIGQLIFGIIGHQIFFKKLLPTSEASHATSKLSKSHFKSLLSFSWPIALAVGLGWVQSQGYRYFMADYLGLAELGLFVAGFGISSGLISGFDSIFSTYFLPKFYRQVSKNILSEQDKAWVEYAQVILPALVLTSVFIMVAAPELTKILLGAEYKESSQFVVWGAMAELARVSMAVFGMVAHAKMNTKQLLLPNFIGALTAIVIIWLVAPIYGSQGVGFGLMLSSLLALFATIYITKKYLAVTLSLKYFFKSVMMCGGLLLFAESLELIFGGNQSHVVALVKLCLLGMLFMLFQYSMLAPVLANDVSNSKYFNR